ncbi:rhomboid family intramembrane serine protease [Acidipila sp. EB88]|uniref:rhomboid family intramembrane serine protease n=1 Tax=Acidipila sp. EB88 TaxID=2305226 RepID=UPI000F5EC289|nr:rhomboid family intramembrane serine protease [Acidipila sp. EB88]RRA48416.1 rhomboid family intramembrane serine protease [Acidipila sp. EB88]
MPPFRSSGMLAFPEFRGFTRTLVIWNVGIYFGLLLLQLAAPAVAQHVVLLFSLTPVLVTHGYLWQLVSYCFLHAGLLGTALELLSLWFLGAFLEANHGSRWVGELFFASVLGAAIATVALAYATADSGGLNVGALTGAFGGIFGLLIAFGVLYGEMQFTLFPLPVAMKAKYLVAVYILFALAQLFGQNRVYALGQLGGALAGYLYIKAAPRRGFTAATSQRYFNLRNDYYRWKRRNAAKKFEVYMRKQNRDVHFDSDGRYVDPDTEGRPGGNRARRDPKDRSWMN